jgi:NAD(P)-dependent dehydrogenase (short-subunit alcohol dehydrogenase family)
MRFTETLAAEVKPHNIAVFATNPGLVRTAMTELQLTTPEGKKWMGRIRKAFEDGVDRPPTDAALLIRRLVEGDFFTLTGRRFGPDDDPALVARDAERILADDLRTLRFNG